MCGADEDWLTLAVHTPAFDGRAATWFAVAGISSGSAAPVLNAVENVGSSVVSVDKTTDGHAVSVLSLPGSLGELARMW